MEQFHCCAKSMTKKKVASRNNAAANKVEPANKSVNPNLILTANKVEPANKSVNPTLILTANKVEPAYKSVKVSTDNDREACGRKTKEA